MEDLRKAVHALFEQRLQRLRRHVAAGEAGAAGGDHHVDRRRRRSRRAPGRRSACVVGDDGAADQAMAGLLDALRQRVAGPVVGQRARVGNGQHRDADRNEGACFRRCGSWSVLGRAGANRSGLPSCVATYHHPDACQRHASRASTAACGESNRPKQVAPEPDMRASSGAVAARAARMHRRSRAQCARAGASRSLRSCGQADESARRSGRQCRRSGGIVLLAQVPEDLRRRDRNSGLTSTIEGPACRRCGSIRSPMPRASSGRSQAHRHVGAELARRSAQVRAGRGSAPEPGGRAASPPHRPSRRRCRRRRQVLVKRKFGAEQRACPRVCAAAASRPRARATRLSHEIVVVAGQRGAEAARQT